MSSCWGRGTLGRSLLIARNCDPILLSFERNRRVVAWMCSCFLRPSATTGISYLSDAKDIDSLSSIDVSARAFDNGLNKIPLSRSHG
jgi:hypothetical protein